MPIGRGSNNIGKSYVGSTPILREYIGSKLIFDASATEPSGGDHAYWRIILVDTNPNSARAALVEFRKDVGVAETHGTAGDSVLIRNGWTYNPDNAFDGNISSSAATYPSAPGDWIGRQFDTPRKVTEFRYGHNTASSALNNFDIESSEDGVTWVKRAEVRNNTSTDFVVPIQSLEEPPQEEAFYRVILVGDNGNYVSNCRFSGIQFRKEVGVSDNHGPAGDGNYIHSGASDPANAFDGSGNTSASLYPPDNGKWLGWQFATGRTVVEFGYYHPSSSSLARNFDVESSVDGVTWTVRAQIRDHTTTGWLIVPL